MVGHFQQLEIWGNNSRNQYSALVNDKLFLREYYVEDCLKI